MIDHAPPGFEQVDAAPVVLPLLVIDKSFAHAASRDRLEALSIEYSFLVPSAFYYEVFDPESAKQLQTLTGFPEFRRVDLSTLLRDETESGEPAREAGVAWLRINPKVLSHEWNLGPDESAVIQQYKDKLVEPLLHFWESTIDTGVIGFSPAELTAARGSETEFLRLCEVLRNRDRIRSIAAEIGFRHAKILDDSWLHYRKFQTWILHGLILWRRYQNRGDMRSRTKIEHDMHDIEYLMLGLHAGNLATCETSRRLNKASMGWRFKLLRPQGYLVTTEPNGT